MTVALSLAYAVIVALLLNLGLASRWGLAVKLGAIVVASGFYIAAFEGHKQLMGWATSAEMPEQFRLHWITIEEPDKASRSPGSIFFWISELDVAGLVASAPRAYRLPWDEATAQAAEDALAALNEGEPLNGFISRGAIAADEDTAGQDESAGGSAYPSGDDGLRPSFEFRRVPPPTLPPKPPPG
ncbi:MAG: hypothetical protein OXF68_15795 [Gammaproteobacteria bacterium]|nr:hypothetical protein [Gammaproteobacteria bacterium]